MDSDFVRPSNIANKVSIVNAEKIKKKTQLLDLIPMQIDILYRAEHDEFK